MADRNPQSVILSTHEPRSGASEAERPQSFRSSQFGFRHSSLIILPSLPICGFVWRYASRPNDFRLSPTPHGHCARRTTQPPRLPTMFIIWQARYARPGCERSRIGCVLRLRRIGRAVKIRSTATQQEDAKHIPSFLDGAVVVKSQPGRAASVEV